MEILYTDPMIVVCLKPVGLDSEHAVPEELSRQLSGRVYPLHRLDQNVGGVMVYARTREAAALFSRRIQEGAVIKEYVALAHGQVPEQGDWEDLLFKDSRRNKVFVVDRQRSGVKAARLEFTRMKQDGDTALVRVRLHTGRSHQIRVQFASRGFPLVGDRKYGAHDKEPAPMLFSCCLTFPHKSRQMRFEHLPDWAK